MQHNLLQGKVLVTGGSGFLARGIYRRAERDGWPAEFTSYSRHEESQDKLKARYPEVRCVLGDVRDLACLTDVMYGHDSVIHAAALKRVPESEFESIETVKTNVLGSLNVIQAAKASRIERVVGISSDKACASVNAYGMTKALLEKMFAVASTAVPTFTCVRYGNVVGSTGSVIPLFQRQYEELGRVRITDPQMTRFWLGIEEAVDLIVVALTEARPGSIVVPLARAMRIDDVARAATEDGVEMEIIGQRPGEKLHEMLVHYEESVRIVHRGDWLELLPPGAKGAPEAFTVASHTPHHWMTVDEMRELIATAAEV